MMLPELFLIVSSVCFITVNSHFLFDYGEDSSDLSMKRYVSTQCVQTVRFSTSSVVEKGETAFRVVPVVPSTGPAVFFDENWFSQHSKRNYKVTKEEVREYWKEKMIPKTDYRAVLATATVCDLVGHSWDDKIDPCATPAYNGYWYTTSPCLWDEKCLICGKRRRKVTKEMWVEEP